MVMTSPLCVQGNCTQEPPSTVALQLSGPSLLPLKDRQCLLVVSGDTVEVQTGNAWLDNLYFRVRSTAGDNTPIVLTAHSAARLWATDVTVQGDASPSTQALLASGAAGVYARGVSTSLFGVLLLYADCFADSNWS